MRARVTHAPTLLALVASGGLVLAQPDTTFTYQGSLKDLGEPANGAYDIDVTLWDSLAGGSQVGSEVMFSAHPVVDGVFTLELDFGAAALDGGQRYLGITVNGTELAPRQPVARAPYAIQTRGIFTDANNMVGIGTDQPQAKLHVDGDMAFSRGQADMRIREIDPADPRFEDMIDFFGIGIGSDTGNNRQMVMVTDGFWFNPIFTVASTLDAGASWLSRFAVTQGGFVGIGTSTPDASLDIAGQGRGASAEHLLCATVDDAPGDFFRIDNTTALDDQFIPLLWGHHQTDDREGLFFIGSTDSGNQISTHPVVRFEVWESDGQELTGPVTGRPMFAWSNGDSNVMLIDKDGELGIGTHAPNAPIHVVASTGDAGIRSEGVLYGAHLIGDFYGAWGATFSGTGVLGTATDLTGTGKGVLGESSANQGVGVQGVATSLSGVNIGVRGISRSSAGFDFIAEGAGIDYGASSSIRWKTNVEPIADPLGKLGAIRGVTYDWDEAHGGRHDIGFIAEEVGAVIPEIVQYEENGIDAIAMDYSKVTPLLVEAVRELLARHEAEVEMKDAQIAELTERIARLESLAEREGAH